MNKRPSEKRKIAFQTASSFVKSQIIRTQDDGTGGLAGLFDGQD